MYILELISFYDWNLGRKFYKVMLYVYVYIFCYGMIDCKYIGLIMFYVVRYVYFLWRINFILGLIISDLCIKFMVLKIFDFE